MARAFRRYEEGTEITIDLFPLDLLLIYVCGHKKGQHTMLEVGKAKSFKIAFPDEDLKKLQDRLDDAELPLDDIVPDAKWEYGSNLTKLRQLVEDWKQGAPRGVDGQPTRSPQGVASWWRGVEKDLNK